MDAIQADLIHSKIGSYKEYETDIIYLSLNTNLDALREAHSSKDAEKIDETSNKLNETWQTISTRLYQQSQEEPQNESATETSGNDEVQDADFEEVK